MINKIDLSNESWSFVVENEFLMKLRCRTQKCSKKISIWDLPQNVKELTFIFMETFDLNIKECISTDGYSKFLFNPICQSLLQSRKCHVTYHQKQNNMIVW
jgi:hypothetical protein